MDLLFNKYKIMRFNLDKAHYGPIIKPLMKGIQEHGRVSMDSHGCALSFLIQRSSNRSESFTDCSIYHHRNIIINSLLYCWILKKVHQYVEDEYPTYHATLRRSWGNISYPYSQTLVHPHTSNHKKLVSAFYLKLPHNNSGDLVGVDWTDAMFATYKDQRRIEQSKFKKLLEEQSNPLEYKLKHGNQCSERILENYEQDKYYFKVREGDLIIHDSKLPHGGTAITTNDSKVCLIMTFDLIPK